MIINEFKKQANRRQGYTQSWVYDLGTTLRDLHEYKRISRIEERFLIGILLHYVKLLLSATILAVTGDKGNESPPT